MVDKQEIDELLKQLESGEITFEELQEILKEKYGVILVKSGEPIPDVFEEALNKHKLDPPKFGDIFKPNVYNKPKRKRTDFKWRSKKDMH